MSAAKSQSFESKEGWSTGAKVALGLALVAVIIVLYLVGRQKGWFGLLQSGYVVGGDSSLVQQQQQAQHSLGTSLAMSRMIPGSERFAKQISKDPAVSIYKGKLLGHSDVAGRIGAGGRIVTVEGTEPFHPQANRPTLDTFIRNKSSSSPAPLKASNPYAATGLSDLDSFKH